MTAGTQGLLSEQQRGEIEALVFAAEKPVSSEAIAALASLSGVGLDAAMEELASFYAGRGIRLEKRDGGWVFAPAPDVAATAAAFHRGRRPRKLSSAALSTLAIIAMHQPVTIPDIEAVRGVKLSRTVIDVLVDAGLVRELGQRAGAGRATTYVTTDAFLDRFGLESISDMPTAEEATMLGLGETEPADQMLECAADLPCRDQR